MATRQTKADMAAQIAEQAELIEELRALIQAQNERQADEAIAKTPIGEVDESVIDRVNHRVNEYGDVLNVRLAEGYDGPVTFAAMAKALGTTIAPRGKRREDKNGRVWIDLYPSVNRQDEVAA